MEKKNALIVLDGGRPKGNTAVLVESFAEGLRAAGHQVDIVSLMEKKVGGCTGCNACRFGKPCVQKDAFQSELVPLIRKADLIALACPLYFWTITARLKAFIERLYCLAEKDSDPPLGRNVKYPDKDCVLLMTAADNYFWSFRQAESYYQLAVVNYIGFRNKGTFLVGGCWTPDGRPNIKERGIDKQAFSFGQKMYRESSEDRERNA